MKAYYRETKCSFEQAIKELELDKLESSGTMKNMNQFTLSPDVLKELTDVLNKHFTCGTMKNMDQFTLPPDVLKELIDVLNKFSITYITYISKFFGNT
jgi:hypothetical protein